MYSKALKQGAAARLHNFRSHNFSRPSRANKGARPQQPTTQQRPTRPQDHEVKGRRDSSDSIEILSNTKPSQTRAPKKAALDVFFVHESWLSGLKGNNQMSRVQTAITTGKYLHKSVEAPGGTSMLEVEGLTLSMLSSQKIVQTVTAMSSRYFTFYKGTSTMKISSPSDSYADTNLAGFKKKTRGVSLVVFASKSMQLGVKGKLPKDTSANSKTGNSTELSEVYGELRDIKSKLDILMQLYSDLKRTSSNSRAALADDSFDESPKSPALGSVQLLHVVRHDFEILSNLREYMQYGYVVENQPDGNCLFRAISQGLLAFCDLKVSKECLRDEFFLEVESAFDETRRDMITPLEYSMYRAIPDEDLEKLKGTNEWDLDVTDLALYVLQKLYNFNVALYDRATFDRLESAEACQTPFKPNRPCLILVTSIRRHYDSFIPLDRMLPEYRDRIVDRGDVFGNICGICSEEVPQGDIVLQCDEQYCGVAYHAHCVPLSPDDATKLLYLDVQSFYCDSCVRTDDSYLLVFENDVPPEVAAGAKDKNSETKEVQPGRDDSAEDLNLGDDVGDDVANSDALGGENNDGEPVKGEEDGDSGSASNGSDPDASDVSTPTPPPIKKRPRRNVKSKFATKRPLEDSPPNARTGKRSGPRKKTKTH